MVASSPAMAWSCCRPGRCSWGSSGGWAWELLSVRAGSRAAWVQRARTVRAGAAVREQAGGGRHERPPVRPRPVVAQPTADHEELAKPTVQLRRRLPASEPSSANARTARSSWFRRESAPPVGGTAVLRARHHRQAVAVNVQTSRIDRRDQVDPKAVTLQPTGQFLGRKPSDSGVPDPGRVFRDRVGAGFPRAVQDAFPLSVPGPAAGAPPPNSALPTVSWADCR